MDGFDRGNQFSEHVAGFSSNENCENWYKHGNLGLFDVGLQKSHIYWNVIFKHIVVCGVQMREPLKKWKFSAILANDLVKFNDVSDSDNIIELHSAM